MIMAAISRLCRAAGPIVRLSVALMWGFGTLMVQPRRVVADEDDLLTVPELLVPKRGQDLSAYRYDSDVFGWDKSFQQVAAIASDVTRGPKGKHRGEVFMLVYPVGETLPVHNIQVHVITHADFPDDPVPLDDVRDMMWTLENPTWLDEWPVRPRRKFVRGFMKVTPIYEAMSAQSQAHTTAGPKDFETAPAINERALCTPGVGFLLHYRGKTRVVPHVALDLQVRCDLLELKDYRIYWGKADVAVAMVRFDFTPQPQNEQSARFVVSAAWRQAQPVDFVASAARPISAATRRLIAQATKQFGPLRFVVQGGQHKNTGSDPEALVAITAAPKWLALARSIARALGAGNIDIAADDGANARLTLYFGVPKAWAPTISVDSAPDAANEASTANALRLGGAGPNAPASATAPNTPRAPFGASVPAKLVDSPTPQSSALPLPLPLPVKSQEPPAMSAKPKSYLDDWRVP